MRNMHYIDKTECLEKGIVVFPSIYIMGAAATGKSVLVEMFLKKHPQVVSRVVDMEELADESKVSAESESGENVLGSIFAEMNSQKRQWCLVFENLPANAKHYGQIAKFIRSMPEQGRVILVGRESLPEEFLSLLWKRKLEIVSQEQFAFTRDEVAELAKFWDSTLNPDILWEKTGGWAGCVDLMLRMSMKRKLHKEKAPVTVDELKKIYEIRNYIEECIVRSLKDEERNLFGLALNCPWINEELCEAVFPIADVGRKLQNLARKGFLSYNQELARYKAGALFAGENCHDLYADVSEQGLLRGESELLGQWFEQRGYLREALFCYERTANVEIYKLFVSKYFHLIPFGYRPFMKGKWIGEEIENYYLRGMQCYMRQDFRGLKDEILRLTEFETENIFLKKEILLNLYYSNPDVTLDEWLLMLEDAAKEFKGQKFRLYNVLGNSCTYLCGIRDLTGMFACTRKEENSKAKVWKNAFGEREWTRYVLAKLDYYLETDRLDAISEEEMDVLYDSDVNQLAKIYLIGKLHRVTKDDEYAEEFQQESRKALATDDLDEARIAEAYISSHSPWVGEAEKLTRWLKRSETDGKMEVNEHNYCVLWFMAKGYLLLGQYKKTERILKRLIPYIKTYRRQKFLAEALFQMAVISKETGSSSQALQSIIESFYISGNARYVRLYTSYGVRGKEALETYEEWYRKTEPEGWSRKKKYQYGNVLRMPVADYLDVIMRGVRREARSGQILQPQQDDAVNEHLTMMETIILQDIGRGLTNQEICVEQNLKMPTVKTHIYSLYKKLGVNSRVQATIKGKEMGILE